MAVQQLLAEGQIVREPPGNEPGYWAGAPGAFYAADEKALYLTYRLRRPRGVAPDRGGEARIAKSVDLKNYADVWSVTKDQFGTASIERCAVLKGKDGQWRYFASFVDPEDGRWCVSVIKAPEIAGLDPTKFRRLFTARRMGLEGVKDPWIMETDGLYYMLLSVALRTPQTSPASHGTLDIFNTGECLSATSYAISEDLDHWEWKGVIFSPNPQGWDAYCRRINSVLYHDGNYLAFYDGSASHKENYEEKTGLAVSSDLKNWSSLSPQSPALASPAGSGSLRYLDAQLIDGALCLFYEIARADGAHELRCLRQTPDDFLAAL